MPLKLTACLNDYLSTAAVVLTAMLGILMLSCFSAMSLTILFQIWLEFYPISNLIVNPNQSSFHQTLKI